MGSAVNDGVAELGGSLGVAILGSLLSLGYRNEIEAQITAAGDAIASIPSGVIEAVRESLAALPRPHGARRGVGPMFGILTRPRFVTADRRRLES